MSRIVADRYSKALYQEATDAKVLEAILDGLRQVRSVANKSPELKGFLNNPLLTYDEQSRTLHALFENKVPALLTKFFDFIASKRRLNVLLTIVDSFEAMYYEAHNEIIMTVKSAHNLDDSFKKKLSDKITQLTGKKVIGQYSIDKSIIGGIRVWAAGKLYEYSFNNELQDYKRKALQNV
jgi:F-type H+-transporting ATPase subunit delta